MLKHRVIPCVLLKDWQLTKSVKFKDFRTIGHPKVTAKIYNSRNVDELIVLDIDASKTHQEINYEIFESIAEECFMPLTLGGGIRSLDQVQKLLSLGADKVALNTVALEDLSFVEQVAERYGSQCVVVSVDVAKIDGHYRIFKQGEPSHDLDLLDYLTACQTRGAGEILLTNRDFDGTEQGYDLELLMLVRDKLSIPIIINGGAGNLEHCLAAIEAGADAIAAASIFHFTQHTPLSIKTYLNQNGHSTRIL
jgi:cyclase